MLRQLISTSLLAYAANAATGEYNYKEKGADWTGTCATGKSQSPIDLPRTASLSDKQKVELNTKYPDSTSATALWKTWTINVYQDNTVNDTQDGYGVYSAAWFTKTL